MRQTGFEKNNFYHIYNRGNSKQDIFLDHEDYMRFLKILFLANSQKKFNFRDIVVNNKKNVFDFDKGDNLLEICSYVLMKNHFHLLIYIPDSLPLGLTSGGKFMQKVMTSYTMYFNKKYNRTGSLFEGSYKVRKIDSDEYLKYIFSYIHLNPIKYFQFDWKDKGIKNINEAKNFIKKYLYSSYPDIILNESRDLNKILINKKFLASWDELLKQKESLFEWLSFK